MKEIAFNLYKVIWKHTANTYVVCHEDKPDRIKEMVRNKDNRYDDIDRVEKVDLPSFDDSRNKSSEYVHLFTETNFF